MENVAQNQSECVTMHTAMTLLFSVGILSGPAPVQASFIPSFLRSVGPKEFDDFGMAFH
jgi:hypothetical protein